MYFRRLYFRTGYLPIAVPFERGIESPVYVCILRGEVETY